MLANSSSSQSQVVYLEDRVDASSPSIAGLWGWLILILTYVLFVASMYALVLSKFMPDTGVPLLDFIKYDTHYAKVIPVSVLMVSFLWVYLNWAALKFFKHN